jgi:hypothetical protein
MRVKFTQDFPAYPGQEPYAKGQVVHLDQGLADQVIESGHAKAFPLSDKEVAEQATKYYAGDDKRTPKQIADRVPQVVVLQGDTRTATEAQRGDDDPHVVREADEETAAQAAERKLKENAKAKAEEEAAAEKQRKADEKARADAAKAPRP